MKLELGERGETGGESAAVIALLTVPLDSGERNVPPAPQSAMGGVPAELPLGEGMEGSACGALEDASWRCRSPSKASCRSVADEFISLGRGEICSQACGSSELLLRSLARPGVSGEACSDAAPSVEWLGELAELLLGLLCAAS